MDSNDNGSRLIDFAASRNMVVSSTQSPRKNIHKRTWTSPDGKYHNQIDHVLIDKRNASSITSVRTFRGPNHDTDHYLVSASYRCRISRQKHESRNGAPRVSLESLKDPEQRTRYQQEIAKNLRQLTDMTDESSVEDDWNFLKTFITLSAQTSLGEMTRRKRRDWFDEECSLAINKKNQDRMMYLGRPTRAKKAAFEQSRKEANRILRKRKRTYMNSFIMRLEEDFRENNPREAYKGVNFFKKGYALSTTICKRKNGEFLGDREEIKERWREFFRELLNPNMGRPLTPMDPRLEEQGTAISPPAFDEIRSAVKKLKNNKDWTRTG